MKKVFIDGSAGTTGLRIHERLASREDISLITLPEDLRKDAAARSEAISSSDVTFLQSAVQRLINFIQSGATPTENERFELKRDLIGAINRFELTAGKIELFSKDVIKIVDSLGKKPKRRIISVLAVDDMIDLKTKK